MDNIIMVTDWEKVEADNYYLSKDWAKHTGEIEGVKQAQKLQKQGNLYIGYYVKATDYAVYWQMDSDQIFIDIDGNEVLRCETEIISNNHKHRELVEF